MTKTYEGKVLAKGKRFGIVVARFNEFISERLLEGALDGLLRHGADEKDITVARVPGSFEIPYAANRLAKSKKFDAVICLGAIIRGTTPHFEYVASEVAKGVASTSLSTGVPTIFGVVTADSIEQAIERAGTKEGNRGRDAAIAAIEMADLFTQLKK
ncbi:6,7-dimethyl-8-ribityllumazine synthase [bacterium]|nr:6,7-dimethyl-8-ribityllumazine synthase [bacterium]MCG2676491.1 6,7-dimethyl-8-ribityllumazine synthase [bacterium]